MACSCKLHLRHNQPRLWLVDAIPRLPVRVLAAHVTCAPPRRWKGEGRGSCEWSFTESSDRFSSVALWSSRRAEHLLSGATFIRLEVVCDALNSFLGLSQKARDYCVFLDGAGHSLIPRERLNSSRSVLTWTRELHQKRKGTVNASFLWTATLDGLFNSLVNDCCASLRFGWYYRCGVSGLIQG